MLFLFDLTGVGGRLRGLINKTLSYLLCTLIFCGAKKKIMSRSEFGGVRRTLQVELLDYFGQVMIRILLSKIMLVLCYGVNMVLYACLLSS